MRIVSGCEGFDSTEFLLLTRSCQCDMVGFTRVQDWFSGLVYSFVGSSCIPFSLFLNFFGCRSIFRVFRISGSLNRRDLITQWRLRGDLLIKCNSHSGLLSLNFTNKRVPFWTYINLYVDDYFHTHTHTYTWVYVRTRVRSVTRFSLELHVIAQVRALTGYSSHGNKRRKIPPPLTPNFSNPLQTRWDPRIGHNYCYQRFNI